MSTRTNSPLDELATLTASIELTDPDQAVVLNGRKWLPDDATAYVQFRLAHSLPSVTTYGTSLHPGTVANSYRTMLHKVFNFAHQMKAYDPEKIPRDRILGSIIDVEFTGAPEEDGSYSVPKSTKDAPGIRAVATLHKAAEGSPKIIGLQKGGRVSWEVSLEAMWRLTESAWALPADGGWEFIPWAEAAEDLQACWNKKKRAVDRDFNGVRPVLLMGGVAGRVQFIGVGLVPRGAEPTNQVEHFFAEDRTQASPGLVSALDRYVTAARNRWRI
jgi:hypothetical protein